MRSFYIRFIVFNVILLQAKESKTEEEQCSIDQKVAYVQDESSKNPAEKNKYERASNEIWASVQTALKEYVSCSADRKDVNCTCYANVIVQDLKRYKKDGITREMINESMKFGTLYKIVNKRLYRSRDCMFPARCSGIEHFLLKILSDLPNADLVVNTRDWPQLRASFGMKGVVFSFSKTKDYSDIMYPAWSFWAGGPAISLHPTGIGRWDQMRKKIANAAKETPWKEKLSRGFFRGSRTSDERDSLVLLSRRRPELVDAQYTKNQAWKSPKDTLNADPAKEVSFEDHCQYKYLFNFRGVAASFRLKHLFLCNSLVFHVGKEWNEFFYSGLKPWVHYVPLKSYPSAEEIEQLLAFFQEHDELAQQIANRGYQFIWNHLRMQDVECYWRRLLVEYQTLLKYEVAPSSDLIEITN